MCEKDWRCRKRGTQAMRARLGNLAGVTRAQQRQSIECAHTLYLRTSATRIVATPGVLRSLTLLMHTIEIIFLVRDNAACD
jgi:hypothetical protein